MVADGVDGFAAAAVVADIVFSRCRPVVVHLADELGRWLCGKAKSVENDFEGFEGEGFIEILK